MLYQPSKRRLEPEARLVKLLDWLKLRQAEAVLSLRQADLLEDRNAYLRELQRSATWLNILGRAIAYAEELENGSEDPNKVMDSIGADPMEDK
jgi:hypothetical protein